MKHKLNYFALGILVVLVLAAAYGPAILRNFFTTHTDAEIRAVQPINVKLPPYNAVGDGVTDDTDALQAVADFIATNIPSPKVFIPRGTYLLSRPLVLARKTSDYMQPPNTDEPWNEPAPWHARASLEFEGESMNGTVFRAMSNMPALIVVTNWGAPSTIRNFTIDGSGMATNGLELIRYPWSLVERLILRSNIMAGISACNVEGTVIRGCWFMGYEYLGDLTGSNGRRTVYGLWLNRLYPRYTNTFVVYGTNVVRSGTLYNVSDICTVEDNLFSHNQIGVVLQASASGFSFTRNTFTMQTGAGMVISPGYDSLDIRRNYFEDRPKDGLVLRLGSGGGVQITNRCEILFNGSVQNGGLNTMSYWEQYTNIFPLAPNNILGGTYVCRGVYIGHNTFSNEEGYSAWDWNLTNDPCATVYVTYTTNESVITTNTSYISRYTSKIFAGGINGLTLEHTRCGYSAFSLTNKIPLMTAYLNQDYGILTNYWSKDNSANLEGLVWLNSDNTRARTNGLGQGVHHLGTTRHLAVETTNLFAQTIDAESVSAQTVTAPSGTIDNLASDLVTTDDIVLPTYTSNQVANGSFATTNFPGGSGHMMMVTWPAGQPVVSITNTHASTNSSVQCTVTDNDFTLTTIQPVCAANLITLIPNLPPTTNCRVSVQIWPGRDDSKIDLVGNWHFDETSGNAIDSWGGNMLTNSGGATFGTGLVDNCAIQTTNQYFYIDDTDALSTESNSFTFMGLFQLTTVSNWNKFLAGKGQATNEMEWMLMYDAAGVFGAVYYTNAVYSTYLYSTVRPVPATWYFLTCIFDAATSNLVISVDNADWRTNKMAGVNTSPTTARFSIGGVSRYTRVFDGKIDECAYFSRALSRAEVEAAYNNATNGQQFFTASTATGVPASPVTEFVPLMLGGYSGTIGRSASWGTTEFIRFHTNGTLDLPGTATIGMLYATNHPTLQPAAAGLSNIVTSLTGLTNYSAGVSNLAYTLSAGNTNHAAGVLQAATNYSIGAFQSGSNLSYTLATANTNHGAGVLQSATNYTLGAFGANSNLSYTLASANTNHASGILGASTNYTLGAFQSGSNLSYALAAANTNHGATVLESSTNYTLGAFAANSNLSYALAAGNTNHATGVLQSGTNYTDAKVIAATNRSVMAIGALSVTNGVYIPTNTFVAPTAEQLGLGGAKLCVSNGVPMFFFTTNGVDVSVWTR